MISFKPFRDYQELARAGTSCATDVTQCENCGHDLFLRYETTARSCQTDQSGILRIAEEDTVESKIEYMCENCGLEHKDWQFREIAW